MLVARETMAGGTSAGAVVRSRMWFRCRFSNGGYWYRDRAYNLAVEPAFLMIPHTASTLTVVWKLSAVSGSAAQQWQGGDDESWAIDNLHVELSGGTVPAEASTWGAIKALYR